LLYPFGLEDSAHTTVHLIQRALQVAWVHKAWVHKSEYRRRGLSVISRRIKWDLEVIAPGCAGLREGQNVVIRAAAPVRLVNSLRAGQGSDA
jgi:hypothetical protein